MILLLAGEPGTGKTFGAMTFPEPVRVLDMENRDTAPKDRLVDVMKVKMLTKDYLDDYAASLRQLRFLTQAWVMDPSPPGLVLDTVSDIRNTYCYIERLNEVRAANPKRTRLAIEEWGEVNDKTEAIIFPLINRARKDNLDLILIAQMDDEWGVAEEERGGRYVKVKARTGRKRACQNWVEYHVDTILNFHAEKRKGAWVYTVECTKSPVGCWTEDVTGLSLYDVLLEKGL